MNRKEIFEHIDAALPNNKVKRNLSTNDAQKVLDFVLLNGKAPEEFLKIDLKRKRVTINKINVDLLKKPTHVVRGVVKNADDLAPIWKNIPSGNGNWTTKHVQVILDTMFGVPWISQSISNNTQNNRIVNSIHYELLMLVNSNWDSLGPLFDPAYCVCNFSSDGHVLNTPPPDWETFIDEMQHPQATQVGGMVFPVWRSGIPQRLQNSWEIFAFAEGAPNNQVYDAHSFQDHVRQRYQNTVRVDVFISPLPPILY